MPHLQFEINKNIDNKTKKNFAAKIRDSFSEVMQTGTDHIAISIREYDKYNLSIGRANPDEELCLMNLDIREGRTLEQRRVLALRFMSIVNKEFKIANRNQYITFTEHKGEDFHLIEKYLASWKNGEDPLA
ncbi:tautomerase [Halarcobacter ebronensis]|uniref:Tautomerase n=1 Tax=Halarcobacter ebronensis TaxID=1462615 RepID=A0A4Q0YDD8_9BACT|nr:tautomerase [Halarcobacter ebronensis]RXJ68467.1 tautomerase [Halarcobacter ebronensis]